MRERGGGVQIRIRKLCLSLLIVALRPFGSAYQLSLAILESSMNGGVCWWSKYTWCWTYMDLVFILACQMRVTERRFRSLLLCSCGVFWALMFVDSAPTLFQITTTNAIPVLHTDDQVTSTSVILSSGHTTVII